MKTPRDLSGLELAKASRKLGYAVMRQSGSHLRVTTQAGGEHHEAELNPEFVASIERGQADLREGRVRVRKT
jgi:predicted RNA binding protein YcfA (HicA-like mRNA interferase family)